MIQITSASDNHLQGIIDLQRSNLSENLSQEVIQKEGFVTVKHSLELIKSMNDVHAHAIALDDNRVVGYALAMDKSFRISVPFLVPLFKRIDNYLKRNNAHPLFNYIIMGQVCIAEGYRSSGIFPKLYENLRKRLSNRFDAIYTDVACRNTRSIRAHEKVGFKSIEIFQEEGQDWNTIEWKWNSSEI